MHPRQAQAAPACSWGSFCIPVDQPAHTMNRKYNPRPRRTQTLTGTCRKVAAHLDFDSVLALEWALLYLRRGGKPAPHLSGVMRRALALYIRHLTQQSPEAELKAVGRHSAALPVPDEDQRLAELRLHAVPDDQPMPSFDTVRYGARVLAERQASMARLEQLLEQVP